MAYLFIALNALKNLLDPVHSLETDNKSTGPGQSAVQTRKQRYRLMTGKSTTTGP